MLNPLTAHLSTLNFSDPNVVAQVDQVDLGELVINAAHTKKVMFKECSWKGREIDCSEYLTSNYTPLGICYTFNSAEYIEEHGRLTVSRSGMQYALTLQINVEQYDYFAQVGYSAGVKVRCQYALVCRGFSIEGKVELY